MSATVEKTGLRVTVPHAELVAALNAVTPYSEPSSTGPTQAVEIFADGDGLRLAVNNGQIYVERTVPCAVQTNGVAPITAKVLHDIVGAFPGGEIELEDDHAIIVRQGGTQYRLRTLGLEWPG